MPFLTSLPETAHLADLFHRFPENVAPLMNYTNGVLRGAGALSVAEREMIATYTSGLNACTFCHGSHKAYAVLFGFDADLMDAMIADFDSAPIGDKLRPLLAYVRKLNTLPSRLTEADARAVYDAGWDEVALFEAVQVNALFNMMNRIVEGAGINFDYADDPERHPANGSTPDAHAHSYGAFGKQFT
ncbi:peroxidase-related enzyme [Roseobacter sp. YSTF-M11]|uniref:Peroxidase-related enzyme n=1 Tax=Roseobacter insulae TaxID=2859783 RepID=A0A9X1FYG9_9RHOB|nr:peroxidase-related enzyme [Roseobacter insulae]MBW4709667.1 peroxidase-related enzyme [Roseobacter insulae]